MCVRACVRQSNCIGLRPSALPFLSSLLLSPTILRLFAGRNNTTRVFGNSLVVVVAVHRHASLRKQSPEPALGRGQGSPKLADDLGGSLVLRLLHRLLVQA